MKRKYFRYIYILFVLIITSCSVTKFVPDGEYLLDEVKVVSESKELKGAPMKDYVRQKPNSKWFSISKIPLATYSLSGRDSTKRINKFLRRIGDPPVIYDEASTLRSEEELTKALHNMGYMRASVTHETKTKKKKLKLTYKLVPDKAYHVSSIRYDIKDREVEQYVMRDSVHSRLSPGMVFDVNVLDSERQRITDFLLRRGYYKFNKEYITYTADTVANTLQVNLTMHILSPSQPPYVHQRYRINKVNFLLDDDEVRMPTTALENFSDSIMYRGFPIFFNEKPFLKSRTLYYNTRLFPDRLYNEQMVQNTYSSFGRLSALKFTNIRFEEIERNDSTFLDAYIRLSRGKYKSISAELEGTNSAGDLGAAASLSYQHRNLFRGSETFTIKVRGAFEAIKLNNIVNNYTEYGVESSLNFPSFMFPFLTSDFKRRIRATSEVGVKFNSQVRPDFSRRVASTSWSYKWANRQRSQHTVDVVDFSYVYMPSVTEEFREKYLNNNSIFAYNYQDLMIVRSGYSFNFNSARGLLRNFSSENSFSIRANIESAGNLLYGISNIIGQEKTPVKSQKDSEGEEKSEEKNYKIANIAYAQYIKGDLDFAKNIVIDDHNSFAFHVALGIAYPYGNSTILPFEKRYFSGGANSVRGWSVRSLGPGTFEGEGGTIGFMNKTGDIKLDLSAEYRTYLFWKLHGAVFIDAGNIWTIRNYEDQPGGQFKFNTFYKELAVAYGLGIRFDFDFFILRFDGGMKAINPVYTTTKEHFPIIKPKFSRDFAFHFAVGYPF